MEANEATEADLDETILEAARMVASKLDDLDYEIRELHEKMEAAKLRRKNIRQAAKECNWWDLPLKMELCEKVSDFSMEGFIDLVDDCLDNLRD